MLPILQLRRGMARFPHTFIHPIFRDRDIERLKETGDYERHKFIPVRPLNNSQSASIFYDTLLHKFVNHIMRKGNKFLARSLMDKTFMEMKKIQLTKYYATEEKDESAPVPNPYETLHKAVANVRPILETVSVKRGGHTYQVPVPIRPNASLAYAIKWLIEAGKEKEDETRFYAQLAQEIIDAANGVGKVIKRKQDLHRFCEANRAYAHYRWG